MRIIAEIIEQADARALGLMHPQTEGAGQILAGIQYRFAGRGDDQVALALLTDSDGRGQAGSQPALGRVGQTGRNGRQHRQGIVPDFAVVDVGEGDVASGHLPALIRADDFFRAVLVSQHQVSNQLPAVAIIGRTAVKLELLNGIRLYILLFL